MHDFRRVDLSGVTCRTHIDSLMKFAGLIAAPDTFHERAGVMN